MLEIRNLLAFLTLTLSVPVMAAPLVVDNPAAPRDAKTVIEASELWRVGGDDEDYLFGVVTGAAINPAGVTYLLDQQLNEITAIDLDGVTVATFGRSGEGPGEMQSPTEIMMLDDGRVAVLNTRPSKVITYSAIGEPVEDISLASNEGFNFVFSAECAAGRVVFMRMSASFVDGKQVTEQAITALDLASGEVLHDYVNSRQERGQADAGPGRVAIVLDASVAEQWAIDRDGRLYLTRNPEGYEIEVFSPEGVHERTIRREFSRVRRPQDQIDAEIEQNREMAERFGGTGAGDVDLYFADIQSLHPRPNGELWVLSAAGRADDDPTVLGVYDVFDRDGRYERQVEIKAEFDLEADRYNLVGDALVVFEEAVDAAQSQNMMFGPGGRMTDDDEEDEEAKPLTIVRYAL